MEMNSMVRVFPATTPAAVPQITEQTAAQKERDALRAKDFGRFSKTALSFALLYTVCLYKNHHGITYPFFMAGTIALAERMRETAGEREKTESKAFRVMRVFYIVSLMLLSVSKCTTMSSPLLALDGLGILVLMICYLLHLFADCGAWKILPYVKKAGLMAVTPLVRAARPLVDFFAWQKLRDRQAEDTTGSFLRKNARPVLAGVLIAIPLLVVVTHLLIDADVVFYTLADRLHDALRIKDIPGFAADLMRIMFTFFCAYLLCYTIATRLGDKETARVTDREIRYPVATAITVALPLCVVYLVFSLIQIVFLFAGKMRLPEGMTYADYAHQGFYQLLFVSALNILLVLSGTALFSQSRWLNGLLTVMSGCTYIMIASSALRMVMYVRAYQLTFLRLFVLWFLVVLSVLLTGVVVSVYKNEIPLFRFGVVTVTTLYLVFALARPDVHIARYNLSRTVAEKGSAESLRNDHYLCYGLSMDAVPVLAEYDIDYRQFDRYRYAEDENLLNMVRKWNASRWEAENYAKY